MVTYVWPWKKVSKVTDKQEHPICVEMHPFVNFEEKIFISYCSVYHPDFWVIHITQ